MVRLSDRLDMTIVFLCKIFSVNSWHASCALSGQRILIHGGYDGNVALGDTHIFNVGKCLSFQLHR